MANVNVRIDSKLKKEAEEIFTALGISASSAINMFYRQVVRTNGIPFELKAEIPNKETVEAIEEADQIAKKQKNTKTFSTVEEIMDDLINKWYINTTTKPY